MKQKPKNNFNTIINLIREEETRWEGLIELKDYGLNIDEKELNLYCNDSLWVIRWAVIEKIGDLKKINCLPEVFKKLADKDAHVRKTAKKTIVKCAKKTIEPIVSRCCSRNLYISRFCQQFINTVIEKDIKKIEPFLMSDNWLVANKVLHLIFLAKRKSAAPILLRAIKIKNIQKNAIMMLALNNDLKAVPFFIAFFMEIELKDHIVKALLSMNHNDVIPWVISQLEHDYLADTIQQLLIKIGEPAIPYMIDDIHKNKHTERLAYCLSKCTISVPMFNLIEKKVGQDTQLTKVINMSQLKQQVYD